MMVAGLFITGLLSVTQPLHAQDSLNLTLRNAVEMSLKNSKQLKVSQAKIDQATSALKQAMDDRLPDFKISGSYLQLTHPNIDLKSSGSSSGGSGGGVSDIKVSNAIYGMATATMPIYSGFRIRYGIESAQYLEQATKLDAENDKEQIILNTINAFTNLYKSRVAVSLVLENLNQSRQRDNDLSNMEKNGLLARNDLLKAQLQTSNIELTLVNAENNLKLANVSLNLLMGISEKTLLIPDSSSLQIEENLKTIDEYEQMAFINRKDVEALSFRMKAAGSSIKSAKGEYYPSLAVTGGYIAADIPGFLTITNAFNIGLGVQYNLGSLWKTGAKVDKAKAVQREVVANQELLTDNIRMDINRAYEDYLSSKKKIDVESKAVVQSTENYKISKNKYDNSLLTTTDLLDANVSMLQSKINFEVAKADAIVAYNTLLEKAGLLISNQPKK